MFSSFLFLFAAGSKERKGQRGLHLVAGHIDGGGVGRLADLLAITLGTIGDGVHGLLLGLVNLDNIGESPGNVAPDRRVPREHDGHPDAEHTLAEEHVTDGNIDEVLGRLTGLDHVAIAELHGLGTLSAELTGYGDLATLGLVLHDEPEHTIASPNEMKQKGVSGRLQERRGKRKDRVKKNPSYDSDIAYRAVFKTKL
jgi:hypothetical protein